MYLRPTKDKLIGNFVILEKLSTNKHLFDLYENSHSDDQQDTIFTFMMFGPFRSQDDFKNWLISQESLTDRIIYSVYSKRIGQYVGMCSIINIDENFGRAEIGSIWYGKIAQRTEINSESIYLLLDYLLSDLKYRRIEWKCDNDNNASKSAATRLGFDFEGIFRKHMIVRNKNRDTAWFSIIDDDWQSKKKYLQENVIKEYRKI